MSSHLKCATGCWEFLPCFPRIVIVLPICVKLHLWNRDLVDCLTGEPVMQSTAKHSHLKCIILRDNALQDSESLFLLFGGDIRSLFLWDIHQPVSVKGCFHVGTQADQKYHWCRDRLWDAVGKRHCWVRLTLTSYKWIGYSDSAAISILLYPMIF